MHNICRVELDHRPDGLGAGRRFDIQKIIIYFILRLIFCEHCKNIYYQTLRRLGLLIH